MQKRMTREVITRKLTVGEEKVCCLTEHSVFTAASAQLTLGARLRMTDGGNMTHSAQHPIQASTTLSLLINNKTKLKRENVESIYGCFIEPSSY